MVAAIIETAKGKDYRPIESQEVVAFEDAKKLINPESIPSEQMPDSPDLVSGRGWNFKTWGSLFNSRQLVAMQTFVGCLHEALVTMKTEIADEEYRKAIGIYLGLWLDRISVFNTSVCRWAGGSEIIKTPFSGQAIPMIWDYPEVNPLEDSSGTASTQLKYMLKVIEHENVPINLQFTDCKTLLYIAT